MSASSVVYDIIFVVHLMVACISVALLLSLSRGYGNFDEKSLGILRQRFPLSTNWTARIFHLMPLSGIALIASGGADVRGSHLWIVLGLTTYLVAAGLLEARILPLERRVATVVLEGSVDVGAVRSLVMRYAASVNVLCFLVLLATIVMVWQPN